MIFSHNNNVLETLIFIVTVIGWVRVFQKAGRGWWEAIVPIYNLYILTKMTGNKGWWTILFFVPIVNIFVAFIVLSDLARSFGKSGWFGAGIFFFPFIFYPILGFGESTYHRPQSGVASVA